MDFSRIIAFCSKVMNFVAKLLPLKNIIVFESKPDFADNTYAVYKELLKRNYNDKYKFYWILNGSKQEVFLPSNVFQQEKFSASLLETVLNAIKAKLIMTRAKIIIECNKYIYKSKKQQRRIHLKHGLPMKDASDYNFSIGDVDIITVPSEYWVDVCAKEHGVKEDLIKPLGFPRNDILQPKDHKNKTIIWMPTWRYDQRYTYKKVDYKAIMPFGLPFIVDRSLLDEINELFKKNNAYLLIRLHPQQDASGINLNEMTNIKLCDEAFLKAHNTTLYSVLCYTDALISDYSSIYYDYLNLSKPIALAVADFDEYKLNNGILSKDKEEFKENYPAVFLEEYGDLMGFFESVFSNDPDIYKCASAQQKYMGLNDGKAAERIVDYMEENFGL